MSDLFEKAVATVLQHEGGYVNDPSDHGGETKYGISKRQYPNEDIKGLTIERAKAIYFTDFWMRCRINQLPDSISPKVLDSAVLCGPGTAIKLLQRVLDIEEDGVIGPETLTCARSEGDELLENYRDALEIHFHLIARKDPSQFRFLDGWLTRAKS